MKKEIISFCIVSLLVMAGFVGVLNLFGGNAIGTDVSGTVYDGAGGPWTVAGSPYIVVGDVFVPPGETLTIDPGVEVKFNGFYCINVDGTLLAQGTDPQRITMTSNNAAPAHGDWNGVIIGLGGHCEVQYCYLSYAGIGIFLQSSHNNITDSDVVSNRDFGIYLVNSNENNIVNNDASDNQYGIYLFQSDMNHIINNIAFSHNHEFNGSVGASNYTGIYLESSSGNEIMGNDFLNNKYHGIDLVESDNNVIAGNDLYMNEIGGLKLSYSDGNVVSGNTISSNDQYGILIESGSGNELDGNTISDSIYGIQLDSSPSNIVTGNMMSNSGIVMAGDLLEHWNTHTIDAANTVNGKPVYYLKDQIGGAVPPGAGQVILANCKFMRIENQVLTYGSIGLELGFSSYNYIRNNMISYNNLHGMYAYSCQGNYISRNNASLNEHKQIHLYNSSHNLISRGHFFGLYGVGADPTFGIDLEYSDNNYVGGNTIFDIDYGIYLHHCSNNIVINNDLSTDYPHLQCSGIELAYATNTAVSYNRISRFGNGIDLHWADSIMITGNNISSNGEGIRTEVSSNVVVVYNEFWNNEKGIRIFQTNFGFHMHHNNFVGSTYYQAADMEANLWDDGYPSGGNYWSDYSGVDLNQGPGQDIPGSDGIGDTPYVIDMDSQDNYPLMEPRQHHENSVDLHEGWNLVSLPLIQSNTSLDSVLRSAGLDYDSVKFYSALDPNDPWKNNYASKPPHMNDLNAIDHTMGFWVHVTSPEETELVLDGIPHSTPQNILLRQGWNMVGYPSLSNKIRAEALNNIVFGTDIDSVWTFNGETQAWEELGDSDYFEVGKGYWIHTLADVTWNVPL